MKEQGYYHCGDSISSDLLSCCTVKGARRSYVWIKILVLQLYWNAAGSGFKQQGEIWEERYTSWERNREVIAQKDWQKKSTGTIYTQLHVLLLSYKTCCQMCRAGLAKAGDILLEKWLGGKLLASWNGKTHLSCLNFNEAFLFVLTAHFLCVTE